MIINKILMIRQETVYNYEYIFYNRLEYISVILKLITFLFDLAFTGWKRM